MSLIDLYSQSTTTERRDGLQWYPRAHHTAQCLAEQHRVTIEQSAGVIAALSPARQWEQNLIDAETILDAFQKRGLRGRALPLVGSYGWSNIVKAERILLGEDPNTVLFSKRYFKVQNFYHNILEPCNPGYVTIDRHAKCAALNITENRDIAVTGAPEYRNLSSLYIDGARTLGLIPCEFQAVIWVTWKRKIQEMN